MHDSESMEKNAEEVNVDQKVALVPTPKVLEGIEEDTNTSVSLVDESHQVNITAD